MTFASRAGGFDGEVCTEWKVDKSGSKSPQIPTTIKRMPSVEMVERDMTVG